MKQQRTKGLASIVLDTAKAGYPTSSSLSDNEQKSIAHLIESTIKPMFEEHRGNRSAFHIEMKGVADVVKVYIKAEGMDSNPLKANAAKRLGQELAQDWVTFIRNSELLKMVQESSRKLLK